MGVAVGLVFGLGLGVGLGANLNAVGALGTHALKSNAGVLSAHERFRLCSVTEAEADPIPTPAELEAMLARWRSHELLPKYFKQPKYDEKQAEAEDKPD